MWCLRNTPRGTGRSWERRASSSHSRWRDRRRSCRFQARNTTRSDSVDTRSNTARRTRRNGRCWCRAARTARRSNTSVRGRCSCCNDPRHTTRPTGIGCCTRRSSPPRGGSSHSRSRCGRRSLRSPRDIPRASTRPRLNRTCARWGNCTPRTALRRATCRPGAGVCRGPGRRREAPRRGGGSALPRRPCRGRRHRCRGVAGHRRRRGRRATATRPREVLGVVCSEAPTRTRRG